ncbi:MAG: hypothetical protein ACLSH1_00415 [Clostridia bacterium]
MLEGIVLLAFIAALAGCVFTGVSVLWALAGGYLIFLCVRFDSESQPCGTRKNVAFRR